MRVLFSMRHPGYVRNFEAALRELGEREHDVLVMFDSLKSSWLGGFNPIEPICARYPSVSFAVWPRRARDRWSLLARGLRLSRDYLRYLGPEYREAPKLRARAEKKVPAAVRRFPGVRFRWVRAAVSAALRTVERSIQWDPAVEDFLREQRPDVVLVTPLVAMGSEQVEYVRAARRLGVPTGLCVASWDNLTNKGLIHEIPDLITVWNGGQRREAIELHGVPPERVAVTGAQSYDHWFDWQPSTTREDFCEKVGLPPNRPVVLYLCSSIFIAPEEVPFVRRWLRAVRAGNSLLADAGVLIRPHPQNYPQWLETELEDPRAAVWPRSGADPVDENAKSDYFDSIYHCAAVVGVNTSALIESAVVGRPVLTVLDDEFRDTQQGTLHFAHLAGPDGMLRVAKTLDEHVAQLAATLAGDRREDRLRDFVEDFVRPYGLERRAAPIFADAIEHLATRTDVEGFRRPLIAPALRPLLALAVRSAPAKDGGKRGASDRKTKAKKVAPE